MDSALSETDLLSRLGVALAIGLLVGLERGWHTRNEPDSLRPAGLRTFALTGLLGGIAGALALRFGGIVLGAAFLAHATAFILFHWLEAQKEGDLGATTIVAGMVTFMLGAFAVSGEVKIAIAAGVVTTLLLALRERLHGLIASLTPQEINAVLTLVAMSFLLLPLLPNRAIDPWQAINPYVIWLMAIMLALISFGGYVAVKIFGERKGMMMMALAGGLASSTAVTLSFARLARDHPASARLLAAGVLSSGVVMFARVVIVAAAFNPALSLPLGLPMAMAGLVTAIGAAIYLFGVEDNESPKLSIRNPLELGSALKLAALIVVIMLAAKILKAQVGDAGVIGLAALSGIADVDAITLSMARSAGGEISARLAATAILVAVAVNTASKAAMAWYEGGKGIGGRVTLINLAAVAAGGLTIWLV